LSKNASKFTDVANSNNATKPIEVHMYYATWCPHCKRALPEWQTFSDEYNGRVVNGYTINCIATDCADENDSAVNQAISTYKISGYPTVFMLKGGERIDFDSKITKYALDQFVLTGTTS
jgi:thiol-disulfide isomerase/thioredoxin